MKHLDQVLVLAGVKVKYWFSYKQRWTQAGRRHFQPFSVQKKATDGQADISGPKMWSTSWAGIILPWRVLWSCLVPVPVDIIDHFSLEEQLLVFGHKSFGYHQNIKHVHEIRAFSVNISIRTASSGLVLQRKKTHLNHLPQGTKIKPNQVWSRRVET